MNRKYLMLAIAGALTLPVTPLLAQQKADSEMMLEEVTVTARKRAESLQDVPIIILTASEDERHKVRGYQYQADCYMSKPYDLEKLTEVVEKMMADRAVSQPV